MHEREIVCVCVWQEMKSDECCDDDEQFSFHSILVSVFNVSTGIFRHFQDMAKRCSKSADFYYLIYILTTLWLAEDGVYSSLLLINVC